MSNVNYGLWYDFRNPVQWRQPFEEFYAERLTQIADAEKMGFRSCWLTEHHFCDDSNRGIGVVSQNVRTHDIKTGSPG